MYFLWCWCWFPDYWFWAPRVALIINDNSIWGWAENWGHFIGGAPTEGWGGVTGGGVAVKRSQVKHPLRKVRTS